MFPLRLGSELSLYVKILKVTNRGIKKIVVL